MPLSHLFRLRTAPLDNKSEAAERIKVDRTHFPILQGMSLYKLLLRPHGVREPHWHVNADEIGYCLEGSVLVTFYHTNDQREVFLVQKGDAFLIPSGALHMLENVGRKNAELLLGFTHEHPEEFHLSSTLGTFSDAVLGNTWGVSHTHFHKLHRPIQDRFAVIHPNVSPVGETARYVNPYRYPLDASEPILEKTGGSVRMARKNLWPVLTTHALYSLTITEKGMREPHWHPRTAELGYVHQGHARMTIRNPEGKTDTIGLEPGDVYFIPKAYPHHIENLGKEPLHFLLFFDQPMPSDIGFSGSIRAMSDDVLSSLLHVEPTFLSQLHKSYADLFFVDRMNPLDP